MGKSVRLKSAVLGLWRPVEQAVWSLGFRVLTLQKRIHYNPEMPGFSFESLRPKFRP